MIRLWQRYDPPGSDRDGPNTNALGLASSEDPLTLPLRLAVPSRPFAIAMRDSLPGPRANLGEDPLSFCVSEGCLQQYSSAADLGPHPFGGRRVYAVPLAEFVIIVD